MGLNPQQSRAVVDLMRNYDLLQAEVRILVTILHKCESDCFAPVGWKDTLTVLRKSPGYLDIAQRHAALFARIEDAADRTEAEILLATIPAAQIEN
jgi:hypothetical protein